MGMFTQLRVPLRTDLNARLVARARQEERPVADVVAEALDAYLAKRKPAASGK